MAKWRACKGGFASTASPPTSAWPQWPEAVAEGRADHNDRAICFSGNSPTVFKLTICACESFDSQAISPSTSAPLRHCLRARPEVSGERLMPVHQRATWPPSPSPPPSQTRAPDGNRTPRSAAQCWAHPQLERIRGSEMCGATRTNTYIVYLVEAVGLLFEPCRRRPCGVTWDSSRTVVVIPRGPGRPARSGVTRTISESIRQIPSDPGPQRVFKLFEYLWATQWSQPDSEPD